MPRSSRKDVATDESTPAVPARSARTKKPGGGEGRPKSTDGAPQPAEPVIANLEMKGDRLKVFSLQTLLTNKRNRETKDAARLGDVLIPWFEKTVTKPAEKLDGIGEIWEAHVPQQVNRRCRLVGFHRGTLTVALDSATVRAELDAQLRGGLLRTLQTESRGALFRVKTCVQPT